MGLGAGCYVGSVFVRGPIQRLPSCACSTNASFPPGSILQTHRSNRPTWAKANLEHGKAGGPSLSARAHQHSSTTASQFLPAQHSPYPQPLRKPRAPFGKTYLAREPSQALPAKQRQRPAGRATISRSLQMQAEQIMRAHACAQGCESGTTPPYGAPCPFPLCVWARAEQSKETDRQTTPYPNHTAA